VRALLTALPFLLPSIVLFGAFVFYPLGKSAYLGFFVSNPFHTKQIYIGFEQYREVLTSEEFRRSLVVTVSFALYTVLPSIVIGLFLAIFANQKLPGIGVFRTIFGSTLAASVAIASVVWLVLLHPSIGVLNEIFASFGIPSVNWLSDGGWGQRQGGAAELIGAWFIDPNWALISVSLTTIWMNVGLFTIITLAGLQTIPDELYESARIDGAGRWSQFWHVTLPMLSPMLFFATVVGLIFSFQAFGQIRILTQGGPVDSTNTLLYSIYSNGFENFRTGVASVEAIALFVILLLLTLALFRFSAGRVFYGGERQ
jgi:multiple sugar transport system permease protein/sn-glycerol 3-phosphate transport system permease protein